MNYILRKINSTKVIIAYLDILGYSELVKNNSFANEYYAAIDASFFRWDKYLAEHNCNTAGIIQKHISFQVMSDTFVIVFNEGKALQEEGGGDSLRKLFLINFLTFISFFLQDCMRGLNCGKKYTCLFRGAITRGQYYHEKISNLNVGNFIFSKAFCGAAEIEKAVAIYPRIIVDKSVLEELDFSLLTRKGYPDREIWQDNDGFYYLNLYCSMFTHTALFAILGEVAGIIKKGIENNKDNKRILAKYIWYANFHNNFVKEIIESKAAIPCFDEIKENENSVSIKIPK